MKGFFRFSNSVFNWFRRRPLAETEPAQPPQAGRVRGVVDHIIILDGTLSRLVPGQETNAGLIFQLLRQGRAGGQRTVYYEPGMQWMGWRKLAVLARGDGIGAQICRAYGWLASHYRPGDRIFLFGYSRGAFAVRSLAGVIDRVGLLRHDQATERAIEQAWRHYKSGGQADAAQAFSARHCHPAAPIDMVGVFDTVKALGFRTPALWWLNKDRHNFHSAELGRNVRHGFHALGLNETRIVFTPVLWASNPDWPGHVEQVWFRGSHGDVGGHINEHQASRPLSNIPLVWMLARAEALGLRLPDDWRDRFPCDANAPSIGTFKGFGWLLWARRRRPVCHDPSERIHDSVPAPLRRRALRRRQRAQTLRRLALILRKYSPLRPRAGLGGKSDLTK